MSNALDAAVFGDLSLRQRDCSSRGARGLRLSPCEAGAVPPPQHEAIREEPAAPYPLRPGVICLERWLDLQA
jgi:hypothetical protein